jgi:hypothetical protein
MRCSKAVLLWAWIAGFASIASAQGPVRDLGEGDLRPEDGYWSEGKPRIFVSTRSEIGILYAKPYLSFGYGLPHWIWAGLDVNGIITPEFVQGYAGVRAASPVLDLAFGVRNTKSFSKPLLVAASSYGEADVLPGQGEGARYWAWEAEIVATAPLPYSALIADFIAVRTLDVPAGRLVYDESYRGVVRSPLFFVLRTGAVARLLNEEALKVGVVVEHLFGTGRNQPIWRVGPAFALQITDHLEAMAALTLHVAGPDALGLALGAYGVAGVRYRWATGEQRPELPWTGEIIP